MYKRPDAITRHIKDLLRVRPMRLYELQKEIDGISIHKLNTLEIQGVLFAERSVEHKQTTYYLLPEKLEQEDKESGVDAPLKSDLPTVNGGNDARIRN